ncbi:hypothetical protein E2C01_071985 [Portunus trituberculatus]|uniref:Uncharacterized protein n=1 Tax=Portunus trituberculatus TaxID=210409 RepID=A0A5B7I9G2_PORTR|nr:hypothetical protein [Portunus trituberculatus]
MSWFEGRECSGGGDKKNWMGTTGLRVLNCATVSREGSAGRKETGLGRLNEVRETSVVSDRKRY